MSALLNRGSVIIILLVALSCSRFFSCDCPVCNRPVFVLSAVEMHVGPFRDIPTIHPECFVDLRDSLEFHYLNIHTWFEERGYYYSDKQLSFIGAGPVNQHLPSR